MFIYKQKYPHFKCPTRFSAPTLNLSTPPRAASCILSYKVILSLIHIPSALHRSPGIPLCLFHHFLLAVFNYTGYFQPRRPMIEVYGLPRL